MRIDTNVSSKNHLFGRMNNRWTPYVLITNWPSSPGRVSAMHGIRWSATPTSSRLRWYTLSSSAGI